jgi:putative restriction endonuclease
MPTEKTWQQWLERLYNLRRDRSGSYERPHKPVLLLAILDLLDRGLVIRNEIPLSTDLVKTFNRYFDVVRQHNDQPTIENPFYHLCGDGFWQLVPKAGQGPLYELGNASRVPTMKALREIYGRFDENLWNTLLNDAHSRHLLREALIARYFPEYRDKLAAIAAAPTTLNAQPSTLNLSEEPPGRDGAFRHTILEIYDYRCAACGIRVKISDALSLVEADHIIPFGVSRNDKPDNGLALCPNHHWAMDRFLIAPCPDSNRCAGIWRVGSGLDARIEGQKDLVALANQPVIPPSEEKFYPSLENLRWREKHLNAKY